MATLDNLPDLTTAVVDGTGAFDVLMQAVNVNILEEYNKGRIHGPEYAQVYLGAMQSVMNMALEFILRKEIAEQEYLNAQKQNEVLEAEKCKLQAEFDVLAETRLKVIAETALLTQKKLTEQAQVVGTGVDADSVIGRQRTLYERQADGFLRDAEQKAAKTLIDTWNVRRTTDSGTVADGTNRLDDATIGSAVLQLLTGAGI